jgi:hypothetical protein
MRISLRNNLYLWAPVLFGAFAIVLAIHGVYPLHVGALGDPIGGGPPSI